MKKQKQWGEEYTILGRSMRGFLDIQIFVPVRSISHFEPFSFLVLYLLLSQEFSTRVWGGDCSDMGFSTLMASYGMTKLARDLNSLK